MGKKNRTISASEQISSLCAELFHTSPISSFVFFRFNRKRELIAGMSTPDLYDFYLKYGHAKTDFQHRDFDKDIPQGAFFLESVSTTPKERELTQIMQDQFDAANFMGIARKNADYCDIYNFATKKDVKNSNNFYLNNIDLLEKYIDLLKEPLEKIITAHDLPKIYIPTIENPFDYDFNDQRVENFSDVVANTLIETQNKLGRIITKRELDCLQLIVQGFTAKEVARVLSISTRTVENYCEKLKIKFGCRRKQDLIALYAGVFNSTQSTR